MIGTRLKYLRMQKGYGQESFAKELGVSPSTVGMWETDKREPNDETKIRIAELLDTTVDYLVGNTDNPSIVDTDKIQIGLSAKDYSNITNEQRKQIEEFAKYVLKDNKKDKK